MTPSKATRQRTTVWASQSAAALAVLALINGRAVELPGVQLKQLGAHPAVLRIQEDRPHTLPTAIALGARPAAQNIVWGVVAGDVTWGGGPSGGF